MKIQNKKMIAFLMAIVMIVTFVNFGTLSAFANDDEPIENTEITLEDNTEENSEEQQVEELVSEIPELVSEPSSPDDPTENGSLGNISSGEIDFSQGGDTADLNGLDQPIIYEPVGSSYQYLPDGVYSLKNYGNTNYWASILNASDDANGYAVQTYYTDNPMDSFNRACLFKISRIPNTNRYVIRLMLNNRLGLSLVGSAVRTKELPTNDADVPASDTFVIVPNGSGYTIKPYNSDYVITVPDSTSSGTSNAKLHRNTAAKSGDRCIWTFYRYTGEPLLGIPLDFSPNDWSYGASLNTEYTVELKPWSTTIGANTPYVVLHPDSVGAATEERIDAYTIKITPTKVGPITIRAQIYVDGTTTTHTSYRCDFITVPDFDDNFAYIENQQTKQFVEIDDSSTSTGAIIQQGVFDGANNSRWTFELEWWGFFSIKSVHSNLYIGVDSSNTSLVKQYSNENDYTKWLFTETSNGSYTIQHKVIDNKVLAVPENNGDGVNLTMVTYSNNYYYWDEWDIEIVLPLSGSEIAYNNNNWLNYVEKCCNCYAYAINNQIYPGTNYLWYKQQMGTLEGELYKYSAYTKDNIYQAVCNDFETYNELFGTNLVFQEVGKYEVCPEGSYKVALVVHISEGMGDQSDYHWYRQDSDGAWSHKPGTTPVKRTDYSDEIIFDPEEANRGPYTQFLGYFAVMPWNGEYESSNEVYCYFDERIWEYNDLIDYLTYIYYFQ